MEPIHIVAPKESIADVVLLPGDPLRAKYIAEKFLRDYKLVNTVRNMYAFTGFYKDKLITVMGSGMGCPSIGIYSYELYKFYDVKKIIRIGSSGANKESVKKLDVVLSSGAYSESSFAYMWNKSKDKFIKSSSSLNNIILETAKEMGMNIHYGPTYTGDTFDVYSPIDDILKECPINDELLCTEMEGFALMHIANCLNKEASMLTTVVDSKFDNETEITADERVTSLDNMIKLALEAIIK